MIEVQTLKYVFSPGEGSLGLRKNEKFLILRSTRAPGGQDNYIVRNNMVRKEADLITYSENN